MTRLAIGRTLSLVGTIAFWAWFLCKLLFDWIGRTTVVDDFNLAVDRLPAILQWLFATPWPVPAALATVLTAFLIWLSLPRSNMAAETLPFPLPAPEPAPDPAPDPAPEPVRAKVVATAPYDVPKKLAIIDEIFALLEGKVMNAHMKLHSIGNRVRELSEKEAAKGLQEYQQMIHSLKGDVSALRYKYRMYPDVVGLLDGFPDMELGKPSDLFVYAIKSGIAPLIEAQLTGVSDIHNMLMSWRGAVEKDIMAMRQELSG